MPSRAGQAEKGQGPFGIWSAACSAGEEPYTIAYACRRNRHLFLAGNLEILATDIALSVLDFARVGEYSGRRIEKVPPALLQKYFNPKKNEAGVYSVRDELRKLVKFSYLNFFKDVFPRNVDIVFCRNVMIYFDKEHQQRLVKNFYNIINDPGFLFIGHSETLHSYLMIFSTERCLNLRFTCPNQGDKIGIQSRKCGYCRSKDRI
jgi:chemotaxis protein methyltransferase CheR